MQLVASLCYFSPFISFLICIHRPFDLWKRASKCDLLARGIARPLYRAAIVTWWCWLFFVIMISIGQIITILGLFNTFVLLYRQSNSSKKCIPTFIIDKKYWLWLTVLSTSGNVTTWLIISLDATWFLISPAVQLLKKLYTLFSSDSTSPVSPLPPDCRSVKPAAPHLFKYLT